MRTGRSTASRGLLAAGAAAGLALALGAGSAASADDGTKASAAATTPKTISMRSTPVPRFTGSTSVKSGQPLRIRNLSDPREHGPHTFSLAAANVLPKSRKAMQQCFTPGKICMTMAMAHEFNPQTEEIGLPDVEAGKPGWDRRFSRTVKTGDSWYSETKGEETTRVVSAKAGTVLRFICAVHPEMQGKIRVTK